MKCQILINWKNKKNMILSSLKYFHVESYIPWIYSISLMIIAIDGVKFHSFIADIYSTRPLEHMILIKNEIIIPML